MSSKVLVLGAGASKAYGFPLGSELRTKILKMTASTAQRAGIVQRGYDDYEMEPFETFKEAFAQSQMYSIDAFLGRRTKFKEIGKKCIAAVLLECEKSATLFAEEQGKDHWYQYLWNHYAKCDWDDLSFENLAIVNFNYDRSLREYLFQTMRSTYGKPASMVADKLRTLRVHHVYGTLSDKLPDDQDYIEYGGRMNPDKVEDAAAQIEVIDEGRDESQAVIDARECLYGASGIAFLGFGFDPLNVVRLSLNGACAASRQDQGRPAKRRLIAGTYLGMTDAEIGTAYSTLTYKDFGDRAKGSFHASGCTTLLRETLFLRT